MCEPTQLHHSITVVNLPLLMLVKIFEASKMFNESMIPDMNNATGNGGGIFKDSLIQRVSVSGHYFFAAGPFDRFHHIDVRT